MIKNYISHGTLVTKKMSEYCMVVVKELIERYEFWSSENLRLNSECE
ncbi:MAG: hypothetical protein LBU55_01380 [Elusimicrobiota bacterium]|nr:hypothetical protein [Elusimicrobiota bacterium]